MPRTFFARTFGNKTGGVAASDPARPTLSFVDAQNGTGGTAAIVGSDPGTTNTIYTSPASQPLAFTSKATHTGDGSATLSLTAGTYIGFISSTDGTLTSRSDPIEFTVTAAPPPSIATGRYAGKTIGTGYNPYQPMCFTKVPQGFMLGVNGLDRGFFWDGLISNVWILGIDAPQQAPTVNTAAGGNATAGQYLYYYRYLDEYGNPSNMSPAANITAEDGDEFIVSGIQASPNSRVTQVELWRTQATETITLYLVTTLDLGITSYVDTLSDNALTANAENDPYDSLAFEINGRPNANRFTPPPNWKSSAVWFQDRCFYFADVIYSKGTINLTNGSPTVVGNGVDWSTTFEGRYLYAIGADKGYLISNVTGVPLSIVRSNQGGGPGNCIQQITVGGVATGTNTALGTAAPTGGSFTLTWNGHTTGAISIPATAATVQTALEGLSGVGVGQVGVTGTWPTFNVEFKGTLAGTTQPAITGSGASATGGTINVTEDRKGGSAENEVQIIGINVALGVILGGTFTVTFNGHTTSPIPALGTSAATMQSILEQLPSIGTGNVSVTKTVDTNQEQLWQVTFINVFEFINVVPMTVDPYFNTTSGGVTASFPPVYADTKTVHDGSPIGVNERQVIQPPYGTTGGTFTLTFNWLTTAGIAYNATAATVQAALNLLGSSFSVTGPAGGPWTVEFQGTFAATDVAMITANGSSLQGTNILVASINKGGGGGNEKQTLTVATSTGGTFTLTYGGFTTSGLAYNATASQIQAALAGLASIGAGNISVTGSAGVFVIEFVGALSNQSESLLTGDGSLLTGVSQLNQITLSENYAGSTATLVDYGIRPKPAERNRIYYSEANEPESVPDVNEVTIQHDQNVDDELVGGITFMGGLYLFKQNHLYRLYYVRQPQIDVAIHPIAYRGAFNGRSFAIAETMMFGMDEWGPYAFDGSGVQKIGDAIQDYWRDGKLDFTQLSTFFVSASPEEQTVRFHVALTGDSGPQHAFCYNYRLGCWHLEEYVGGIYGACHYPLSGRDRLLFGSLAERIYLAGEGTLDGTLGSGTVRGTATTAASNATLTDSTATFPTDCVGASVGIVDGAAKGQTRRIISRTTHSLTLDSVWSTAVAKGDTYQVGAVRWTYRTPILHYLAAEDANSRQLRVVYQPTTNAASLDVRRYYDHDSTPTTAPFDIPDNQNFGVSATANSPDQVIDLLSTRDPNAPAVGFCPVIDDGFLEDRAQSHRWVSYELRGMQGQDRIKILGLELYGLEGG